MDSESSPSNSYQQALEDHRQLKALLADIERALDEKKDIEGASHLLGQLGDRIIAHFASEEEGGYFSEAILHSPRLVARLSKKPKGSAYTLPASRMWVTS